MSRADVHRKEPAEHLCSDRFLFLCTSIGRSPCTKESKIPEGSAAHCQHRHWALSEFEPMAKNEVSAKAVPETQRIRAYGEERGWYDVTTSKTDMYKNPAEHLCSDRIFLCAFIGWSLCTKESKIPIKSFTILTNILPVVRILDLLSSVSYYIIVLSN